MTWFTRAALVVVFAVGFLGGSLYTKVTTPPPQVQTQVVYVEKTVTATPTPTYRLRPLYLGLSTERDAFAFRHDDEDDTWWFDMTNGYFLVRHTKDANYEVIDSSRLCSQVKLLEPMCQKLVGSGFPKKTIVMRADRIDFLSR